jgi:aminoglycoside N3'-acetyltransferase
MCRVIIDRLKFLLVQVMLLGVVHNCQHFHYRTLLVGPSPHPESVQDDDPAISSGVLALLCFRPLVAKPRIRLN